MFTKSRTVFGDIGSVAATQVVFRNRFENIFLLGIEVMDSLAKQFQRKISKFFQIGHRNSPFIHINRCYRKKASSRKSANFK